MVKRILSRSLLVLLLMLISGCAGVGLDKKATLIPDEVWIAADFDTQETGRMTEITTGVKYKFK